MDEKLQTLFKYNLWDEGKMYPSGMLRDFYISQIENYMNNRLVKVLTGQRRSGKSFILRQIMNMFVQKGIPRKNLFYLSKEYIDFDFIESYGDLESLYNLYLETFKPEGKLYIFIDEVQMIKQWEKFVNSHSQDFNFDCEIFISGSNSRMLSSELATLLSGRYVEFQIFPFQYNEYLRYNNLESNRTSYLEYLQNGGLPGMLELSSQDSRRQYVSAVKDTIVLRDIIQRKQDETGASKVRDAKLLDDLFVYLVNNASNPVSVQNIINYYKSRSRKVAYETLSNYIQYIRETFLIHGISQYNIRGKEVSGQVFKYYVNDLSFRNYLYPGIAYGTGYLLENAVFLELKRNGFLVYEGNSNGKEVDFVAIKDDRKIYIQVSYSLDDEKTRTREYASLLSIPDNYEKWLVTLDDAQFPIYEGVRHVRAWEMKF